MSGQARATPGNRKVRQTDTAGELRYFFDGTDTWVQGDIGGDGVADFEIALTGSVTLVSTDFIL